MSRRQRQPAVAARRRTTRAALIAGIAAAVAALAIAVIHFSTSTPPPPAVRKPSGPNSGTTMGAAAAKVTLEVFSDFLCSHCADFAAQAEPRIITEYVEPGTVKLVYRHFPIVDERFSVTAAAASECAADQQKFWAYHDELFSLASGGALRTRGDLEGAAAKIGLDQAAFAQCLRSGATRGRVEADRKDGERRGVRGTPTSFVNGEIVPGAQPIEVFRAAIDTALKR